MAAGAGCAATGRTVGADAGANKWSLLCGAAVVRVADGGWAGWAAARRQPALPDRCRPAAGLLCGRAAQRWREGREGNLCGSPLRAQQWRRAGRRGSFLPGSAATRGGGAGPGPGSPDGPLHGASVHRLLQSWGEASPDLPPWGIRRASRQSGGSGQGRRCKRRDWWPCQTLQEPKPPKPAPPNPDAVPPEPPSPQ